MDKAEFSPTPQQLIFVDQKTRVQLSKNWTTEGFLVRETCKMSFGPSKLPETYMEKTLWLYAAYQLWLYEIDFPHIAGRVTGLGYLIAAQGMGAKDPTALDQIREIVESLKRWAERYESWSILDHDNPDHMRPNYYPNSRFIGVVLPHNFVPWSTVLHSCLTAIKTLGVPVDPKLINKFKKIPGNNSKKKAWTPWIKAARDLAREVSSNYYRFATTPYKTLPVPDVFILE